jgi:hypothetical protein
MMAVMVRFPQIFRIDGGRDGSRNREEKNKRETTLSPRLSEGFEDLFTVMGLSLQVVS